MDMKLHIGDCANCAIVQR